MKALSKVLFGLMAMAILPGTALAQADYPSKTVTIVVPFAAGGTTDMLGRILADRLSQRLK
ncbi:MAG: tripartite tricarboxylate transporter substrate binding protein BugD, partial [Rhabdaerophilum sp.]